MSDDIVVGDVPDVPMLDAAPAPRDDRDRADAVLPLGDASTTVPSESELEEKFPNRPRNSKKTLPFNDLCTKLFEPLTENLARKRTGLRGRKEMKPHEIRRNIIDHFIGDWRHNVGDDIFPAFRLIMCDKDRDRAMYNMKEQKIGKLLVKVMMINKESEDGYALLHWKEPQAGQKATGDFAGRCYEVLKKRPMRTSPGELTITEVNEALDRLSQTTSEDQQLAIFKDFYYQMCPIELKWLIRILLRQMKVGASERTFFHAWHPDAEALFNVSSSLRRVCWELYDPTFRLEEETRGVSLMSCFQPQLAQFPKRKLEDVVKAMGDGEFWIEEKLDGERMQMHYENGVFRWWSRKAKEYTNLYGDSVDNGSVARFVGEGLEARVKSVILDGEMITWDPKEDCIVAFGTLKTAAIETSNNPMGSQPRPVFRVFDILHLNGKCLIDYSLKDRRKALRSVLKDVPRRIEVCEHKPAKTASDIESELRKVVETASEGLVIKNPLSTYRLNDRNDDWVKVKPEYMSGFGESLDVLVVGGYWGRGRRGNMLSSFLCGLRVTGVHSRACDPPLKFWSFCRVGGGFKAADYAHIAHITDGAWQPWKKDERAPDWLELAGGHRMFERPDVWIHPERSFVLQVKASSVAETDQFRMGCTLRFPRFERLRDDRDCRTCLSTEAFEKLRRDVGEEIKERKMEMEQRRAGTKRVKREMKIAGGDDDAEPVFLPEAGQVFAGHNFYVMTESTTLHPKKDNKTKPELENLIKLNGGRIFQTESIPTPGPLHVVGDRRTVKVAAIQKQGRHTILTSSWVFDCLAQQCLLPLEPRHIFHAADEAVAEAARANVDRYGDSYARELSVEQLRTLLGDMQDVPTVDSEDGELEELWVAGDDALPGWMMRRFAVYVPHDTFETRAARRYVEYLGGRVEMELKRGVTHVLVEGREEGRLVREVLAKEWEGPLPRVVAVGWVEECVREGTVVGEEEWAM